MMKLGKKPARPNSIKLKFGSYFLPPELPTPPLRFGRYGVDGWGALGNHQYADCCFAGAAHETMLWTRAEGHPTVFSDSVVLADYAAVTGFNPADPSTDQGADMQEVAAYRQKVGIVDATGGNHKIESYVAIEPGNVEDLMLATYLFGAAGVGIQFPSTAMDQFQAQQPWDLAGGSHLEGGHYIPCVGRNSAGNLLVVTWGRLHAMTPEFFQQYCDEAVAYISQEWLDNRLISPDGYDLVTLKRDQAILQQKGM